MREIIRDVDRLRHILEQILMRRIFSLLILFCSMTFPSFAQNVRDTLLNDFEWDIYDMYYSEAFWKPETESQFRELVDFIDKVDAFFVVEAHTDIRGSEQYCLKLSNSGAYYFGWQIKKRLKDPDKVILTIGFGKGKPYIEHPQSEAEHALNCRWLVRFATEEEVRAHKKDKMLCQ